MQEKSLGTSQMVTIINGVNFQDDHLEVDGLLCCHLIVLYIILLIKVTCSIHKRESWSFSCFGAGI